MPEKETMRRAKEDLRKGNHSQYPHPMEQTISSQCRKANYGKSNHSNCYVLTCSCWCHRKV